MLSESSRWSWRAGAKAPTRFSQIWPTAIRRAPGDPVSRELAGGLSCSLIRGSHDQRRVEWAIQWLWLLGTRGPRRMSTPTTPSGACC